MTRQTTLLTETGLELEGRLAPHPSHKIDRSKRLEFEFNGKPYQAFEGDTVASALWAAGVRVLGRSFKYHRPRGAFALTTGDSNTLVRVDDEPNVRASETLVKAGMVVSPQNAWPSLDTDVMSLTRFGSRLMPVGFYYKTFIRPRALWPMYEKVLRHSAGLGTVTTNLSDVYYDKKYEFSDVLVIGGGPAGIKAALTAADAGAQVLLLDENPFLGGHLAYECQTVDTGDGALAAFQLAEQLAERVVRHENINVRLKTVGFGIYDQLWVGALQNDVRLLKIRTKALVIASGAFEQPLLFSNNDLPGVVLGSAVQRLMHLHGVQPGKRAVVLAANNDGLQVALDLNAAGIELARVLELRAEPDPVLVARLSQAGVKVETGRIVTEARGHKSLTGVMLAEAEERSDPGREGQGRWQARPGTLEFVPCDLLVTSIGWTPATGLLYQSKARLAFDQARAEFGPRELPPMVHAAGRVAGSHVVQTELLEGELAGLRAAFDAGFGAGAGETLAEDVARRKAAEPVRTSGLIYVPGGKYSFVSFDEDVTIKDLRDSVQEGYRSMELLKRYSTLSMGPSQGKYESANTIALCAEANGQGMAEIGTTTSRPPYSPVPMGALAGQTMEPVKVSPMHAWHLARGATMMNAGVWKRPEHYGDPAAEVEATRTGLGLIDVSTLGKILLKGPDVAGLLEMLYTNKWQKLAVGRTRYGVMCNDEGVVADDGVVARLTDDAYYMTATTGGAAGVYENIEWNLQSGWDFDVVVNNVTDTLAAMNLTGPQARAVLQPLTEIDLDPEAFPYLGARQGLVAGVPAIVLRIGFTGELGYEMHVPAGYALYLWDTLIKTGQEQGITPFGVEAQRIMRLEKGHFIIGQDTDGLTDPLMAHLDWIVKFDKTDFLGKPSLVRIRQRGISHRLVGYTMRDPAVVPEEASQIVRPNPGLPLGLEIIGRVTSSRFSPTLKQSIGLCWLPVEMSEPGAEFTVRIRGELHQGQVVPLPFYDPPGERMKR
jgi:sarcosine oxidase, subunit alpha